MSLTPPRPAQQVLDPLFKRHTPSYRCVAWESL